MALDVWTRQQDAASRGGFSLVTAARLRGGARKRPCNGRRGNTLHTQPDQARQWALYTATNAAWTRTDTRDSDQARQWALYTATGSWDCDELPEAQGSGPAVGFIHCDNKIGLALPTAQVGSGPAVGFIHCDAPSTPAPTAAGGDQARQWALYTATYLGPRQQVNYGGIRPGSGLYTLRPGPRGTGGPTTPADQARQWALYTATGVPIRNASSSVGSGPAVGFIHCDTTCGMRSAPSPIAIKD